MTKLRAGFDLDTYAPVAERIRLFYERFPQGRIITELVSRTGGEVVFRALVYREENDDRAAATGWASEREGDGDINLVACLENTETSAIGRALANLGFTASRQRPSAEEMEKAARVRARRAHGGQKPRPASVFQAQRKEIRAPAEGSTVIDDDPLQRQANLLADALGLIRSAERLGLRSARARRLRERIAESERVPDVLDRLSMILRRWIDKRRTEALQNALRER